MKKIGFLVLVSILIITGVICISLKNEEVQTKVGEQIMNSNPIYKEPVVDNAISIKAKEIHDYIRENNYGYCTYDERCEHNERCGLNATFEASKKGHHNTCCATYVSWVLQETGYLTKQEHIDNYLNGANNLKNYLIKKGWKEINSESIMPGDIMCYDRHIAIYGGRRRQYDAGNKFLLEVEAPCEINGGMNTNIVLRAPDL